MCVQSYAEVTAGTFRAAVGVKPDGRDQNVISGQLNAKYPTVTEGVNAFPVFASVSAAFGATAVKSVRMKSTSVVLHFIYHWIS